MSSRSVNEMDINNLLPIALAAAIGSFIGGVGGLYIGARIMVSVVKGLMEIK